MDKKIVFVSHPLLNFSEENSETAKEVIKLLAESEIGIIQLPSVEDCDKKILKKLSEDVIKQIQSYTRENFKVLGILGIEFSPVYGVNKIKNNRKIVFGSGVFIEELQREMQEKDLQVPIIPVNLTNVFSTLQKLTLLLKNS